MHDAIEAARTLAEETANRLSITYDPGALFWRVVVGPYLGEDESLHGAISAVLERSVRVRASNAKHRP